MDLTPFVVAFQSKAWPLLFALVIGAIVALTKQGWFSTWMANKLTAQTTPYYALLVSVLSIGSADIVGGKPWQAAVQDVVVALFTAMAGHAFVVKSARKGKEVVPPTHAVLAERVACTLATKVPTIPAPPITQREIP